MSATEKQKANLRSLKELSPEERKRIASNGGKASAAKREQNKSFKQAAEWLLEQPAMESNVAVKKLMKMYPRMNNYEALAISVMARTIKEGDVRGYQALRDTIGEVPVKNVSVQNQEPIKITIETVD